MFVPKMSQLRPGIRVNVVLKADQQFGRLTTGQISDILTRGDHPRGIKVRLSTGQVGRVQSLSTSSDEPAAAHNLPFEHASSDQYPTYLEQSPTHPSGKRSRKFALQEDYRQDPSPLESTSLADYIRPSSSSKRHALVPSRTAVEDCAQVKLEKDFPDLDSALIAAILADHEDVKGARDVLSSLS